MGEVSPLCSQATPQVRSYRACFPLILRQGLDMYPMLACSSPPPTAAGIAVRATTTGPHLIGSFVEIGTMYKLQK